MTSARQSPWVRYLPAPWRESLAGMPNVRRAIGNSIWLFADKIVRMGAGLLVGVWVARYLGPAQFGLLNYVGAIAAMCGTIATVGLNGIVVRDLIRAPHQADEILGTAVLLQLAGGALAFVLAVLAVDLARPGEALPRLVVCILGWGLVFKATDVVKYRFEAQVRARYTVWVENFAFLLLTGVKIVLVLLRAPILAFVWASLAEVVLTAGGLLAVYAWQGGRLGAWRVDSRRARALLRDSWPLVFSSLAIMFYMRIDQVMLGQFLGDREVGVYSAAVKVSEIWYFIPGVIVSSVFPLILASEKLDLAVYHHRLRMLFGLMTVLSLAVAGAITAVAPALMRLLYGEAYAGAIPVLDIHIWGLLFVGWGVVGNSWYLSKNLQRLVLARTVFGALANVLGNLLLIPRHGMAGAAVATLASQALASWLLDFIDPRTRDVFWLKTHSLAYLFNLILRRRRIA